MKLPPSLVPFLLISLINLSFADTNSKILKTSDTSYCTPNFTNDPQVILSEAPLLIVTHASTQWDYAELIKEGLNSSIATSKKNGAQVVYLQDIDRPDSYLYTDCNPNYYVRSYGGGFSFSLYSNEVSVAGGYLGACLRRTIKYLLDYKWKTEYFSGKILRLNYITDAIYTQLGTINPSTKTREYYLEKAKEVLNERGTENYLLFSDIVNLYETTEEKKKFFEYYIESLGYSRILSYFDIYIEYNNEYFHHINETGRENSPKIIVNFTTSGSNYSLPPGFTYLHNFSSITVL